MARLVALGLAVAIFCGCHAVPDISTAVVVDDGRIGIGAITGGVFGPNSFSIGTPGSGDSANIPALNNENNGEGKPVSSQNPDNNDDHTGMQRPPQHGSLDEPSKSVDNPSKPRRVHANSGQRGKGDQEDSGDGQIVIGTVILPKNKGNKRRNNNHKRPIPSGALGSTFASSSGKNGVPNYENEYSNGGGRGNIQIGSITGGDIEQGTSVQNSRRPIGDNVPIKEDTQNNGNFEHTSTENKAVQSIGHGGSSNGDKNGGHGQTNAGYGSVDDEIWIWST